MVVNPDKFQVIFTDLEKCQNVSIEIIGKSITATDEV